MSIIKLSELSEHEAYQFKDSLLVKSIYRKPESNFDQNGLRYTLAYLNSVGGRIIRLPLELMADYVDAITKDAIDESDPVFVLTQILSIDVETLNMNRWNATSLGNMAYVALHCKIDGANKKAMDVLEKYFLYFKSLK